jgi:lysozyme
MARKPAKRPRWVRYFLWLLVILAVVVISYDNRKYFRRAYRYLTHHYYKTTSLPSDFPEDYEVHGIDISHFQDVLDWNKLQAITTRGDTIHFQFVYIKATQGALIEDNMFEENWDDARDHHILRGAYHYFLPDRNAKLQAENFISNVKLKTGDLPPAVDIEEARGISKPEIVSSLKEFLTALEEHYKVKPVLYSNINFIEDYLADDFRDYNFWISHFDEDEPDLDDNIQWLFWQHSHKADLLGVGGNVDVDVFNGNRKELDSLLVK